MRGIAEGPTRACKVCGTIYARKPYGWCYGACCSHACQQRALGNLGAEPRSAEPRYAERTDCTHYRRCFNEAAAEPRDFVCRMGCTRYELKQTEPRAVPELMSHAWMWSEAERSMNEPTQRVEFETKIKSWIMVHGPGQPPRELTPADVKAWLLAAPSEMRHSVLDQLTHGGLEKLSEQALDWKRRAEQLENKLTEKTKIVDRIEASIPSDIEGATLHAKVRTLVESANGLRSQLDEERRCSVTWKDRAFEHALGRIPLRPLTMSEVEAGMARNVIKQLLEKFGVEYVDTGDPIEFARYTLSRKMTP